MLFFLFFLLVLPPPQADDGRPTTAGLLSSVRLARRDSTLTAANDVWAAQRRQRRAARAARAASSQGSGGRPSTASGRGRPHTASPIAAASRSPPSTPPSAMHRASSSSALLQSAGSAAATPGHGPGSPSGVRGPRGSGGSGGSAASASIDLVPYRYGSPEPLDRLDLSVGSGGSGGSGGAGSGRGSGGSRGGGSRGASRGGGGGGWASPSPRAGPRQRTFSSPLHPLNAGWAEGDQAALLPNFYQPARARVRELEAYAPTNHAIRERGVLKDGAVSRFRARVARAEAAGGGGVVRRPTAIKA